MITDTYSIFWREMKRYKKSRGGFYNQTDSASCLDHSYGQYIFRNTAID